VNQLSCYQLVKKRLLDLVIQAASKSEEVLPADDDRCKETLDARYSREHLFELL
jgi:hypothetical protein